MTWTLALAPVAAMRVVWYCDRQSGQMVVDFNTTASVHVNCHNVADAWYTVGAEVHEYRAAQSFRVECDGTLAFFEDADCVHDIDPEYGGVFRGPTRDICTYSQEARVWSRLTGAPEAVCDLCTGWYHEQYRQFLFRFGWSDVCHAVRSRDPKRIAPSDSRARDGLEA